MAQSYGAYSYGKSSGSSTVNSILLSNEITIPSVGVGSIAINVSNASVQKYTVTGNTNISFSGWALANTYNGIILELRNGGLFTLNLPTINWVLPNQIVPVTTLNAYLTALGRVPASLNSNGTDFIYFWSTDGGITIFAKLI